MTDDLIAALQAFTKERKFNRKGPLCAALVMTQTGAPRASRSIRTSC